MTEPCGARYRYHRAVGCRLVAGHSGECDARLPKVALRDDGIDDPSGEILAADEKRDEELRDEET